MQLGFISVPPLMAALQWLLSTLPISSVQAAQPSPWYGPQAPRAAAATAAPSELLSLHWVSGTCRHCCSLEKDVVHTHRTTMSAVMGRWALDDLSGTFWKSLCYSSFKITLFKYKCSLCISLLSCRFGPCISLFFFLIVKKICELPVIFSLLIKHHFSV